MERTIRVIGKGKILVKPDTIRLIIEMKGMRDEYNQAIKESADMTENLKNMFEQHGFSRNELKTLYFNVDAEFESYQAKDKSWKKRLKGYEYIHRTKIEFPANNKILGKVLYSLGHSPIHPEFNIEYTVANPEKSKNDLLENAVKDGMEKAKVLASAANVNLGEIVSIDYSWSEIDFISKPMNRMMLEECRMSMLDEEASYYDIDIEPDDINVEDSVTIVWHIG